MRSEDNSPVIVAEFAMLAMFILFFSPSFDIPSYGISQIIAGISLSAGFGITWAIPMRLIENWNRGRKWSE